jgi:hypothetical protein
MTKEQRVTGGACGEHFCSACMGEANDLARRADVAEAILRDRDSSKKPMIFLIERREDDERIGYDETLGVVVCADDEAEARQMAASECGDEGPNSWLDSTRSTCFRISGADKRVVLVSSING